METKIITVHVPTDFLNQIDDFKFEHRFKFRSKAIKYLLDFALKNKPVPTEDEIREYNK